MSVIDRSTFPSGDLPSAFPECLPIPPEAEEILSLILEQLEGFPSPQRGALLLSRDPSTDRSELLRYLARLLEDPDSPHWTPLLRRLNISGHASEGPGPNLFIRSVGSVDRSEASFWKTCGRKSGGSHFERRCVLSRCGTSHRCLCGSRWGSSCSKIRPDPRHQGAARVQQELLVYRLFFEAFAEQILTVFTGEKEHLNRNRQYSA